MKRTHSSVLRLTIVAFTIADVGACANSATCSPGQELRSGLCLAASPGQSDSTPDAAARDGAGDLGACGADAPVTGEFGKACTDGDGHSDCACPSPICAIQPGQASGFCTKVHCDEETDPCPGGWTCFDLSQIDPSYPSTCLPD